MGKIERFLILYSIEADSIQLYLKQPIHPTISPFLLTNMTTIQLPFVSKFRPHLNIDSIAVRDISLDALVKILERILPEIECAKFMYERKPDGNNGEEQARFEVEYGTFPKIRTLSADQRQYYIEFNNILFDVCDKAIEWFPHNEQEMPEIDPDHLPGPPVMKRCWCMTDINILFNQPQAPDAIILEFFRFSGDHYTKHWIRNYVNDRLKEELHALSTRPSFLSLMDGCPDATGHIARYLFDENVVRDICSYMENPHVSRVYRHDPVRMITVVA